MTSSSIPTIHYTNTQAIKEIPSSNLTLEEAILYTVAYADIFDYPLTSKQIYRYLMDISVDQNEIYKILNPKILKIKHLSTKDGFYFLTGREELVKSRYQSTKLANKIWPIALFYGRAISSLPFVKMVAITGSLTMNNIKDQYDIDFFIVVSPYRVWLCRAMVMVLTRFAKMRGTRLCPNFIMSESSLKLPEAEQNLYSAHEISQMIPITGFKIYNRMRELNSWTYRYLPNADGPPKSLYIKNQSKTKFNPYFEAILKSPAGAWLERREMERMIRKFRKVTNNIQAAVQYTQKHIETNFSNEIIKDHFKGNNKHTLKAFISKLKTLNQDLTRVTDWIKTLYNRNES